MDIGIKRVFKFRERYKLEPEVQFFNLMNSNAVISQGTLIPTSGSGAVSYTITNSFLVEQVALSTTARRRGSCALLYSVEPRWKNRCGLTSELSRRSQLGHRARPDPIRNLPSETKLCFT